MGEKARAGKLSDNELSHLRDELDFLSARGALSARLRTLRSELAGTTPANKETA
jgi:hypothetical protein